MRETARSLLLIVLTLLSAVVLGVSSSLTTAGLSLAANPTATALIMGGSGTPDPDQEPGYVPNVSSYYIFPNSACQADDCALKSIITPEEAWPLYGGPTARTWKQSILDGDEIYREAVTDELSTVDKVVLFGYSQSGAILAIEKRALADDPLKGKLQIVVIANVARPNGGLNGRLPGITLPIVEFPFGPTMPTDTGIETTDIALKWDIIADAPLYAANGLAMLNALIGGPGFGIVHGTYPNPEGVPPTGLVGGYTQDEWQTIMNDPVAYSALHPDIVNVQKYGDTTYITVTPKVLPLVQPLHSVGLGFVADLIEPALRVIIEQTGYDRSIPYGQPTRFRLIPIFNPITLASDVIAAIPQGLAQALGNLGGTTMIAPTTPGPVTTTTPTLAAARSASPPVELSTDQTDAADQLSASKTSNGEQTIRQKTDIDETDRDASATNTSQSSTVDTKLKDTTNLGETTKDRVETKKNSEETKKDPVETKKASNKKQDTSKRDASLNFSPKKPSTQGDTSGTTAGQNETTVTNTTSTDAEKAAA
jgi:hypothetical protein